MVPMIAYLGYKMLHVELLDFVLPCFTKEVALHGTLFYLAVLLNWKWHIQQTSLVYVNCMRTNMSSVVLLLRNCCSIKFEFIHLSNAKFNFSFSFFIFDYKTKCPCYIEPCIWDMNIDIEQWNNCKNWNINCLISQFMCWNFPRHNADAIRINDLIWKDSELW